MAETNKINFLRWSNSSSETTLLPFTQVPEVNIQCSQPILVPTETTTFYWNHTSNTAFNGTINLCSLDNTVISSGIGTVTAFSHADGTHATGTLTCPSVAQGFYKLSLVGTSTLYSNIIEVVTESTLIAETAIFEYWDTKQVRNFKYPYVDTFKNKFRLRYEKGNGQYFREQENQTYINGTEKSISERTYKYFKMRILEADESMRDAVDCMLSHSNLRINGVFYDFKNDSGITIVGENEILANVEFEIKHNYNRVTC